MPHLAVALLALLALLVAPPAAYASGWAWPVRGEVARPFRLGPDPFAAGQHRGLDIVAPAGTPVRSACAGRVRFAGAAGAAGRTVSVECGPFIATYLHLASIATRAHAAVARGERVGTVGATGRPGLATPHLHFGVRRTARRFGYLDPLALLPGAPARRLPPLGPAPRRREPLRRTPPRAPTPRMAPPPRTQPARPAGAPAVVWIGVGLVALGAPAGAAVRRRRRQPPASAATKALASSASPSQSS